MNEFDYKLEIDSSFLFPFAFIAFEDVRNWNETIDKK